MSTKELSQQEVFAVVNSVRTEWVYIEDGDTAQKCTFDKIIKDKYSDKLMESVRRRLNLNITFPSEPLEMTETILNAGHEMFIYLASCPDEDRFT